MKLITLEIIERVAHAYMVAGLWVGLADDGESPLDENYSVDDITDEARILMAEDVRDWVVENEELVLEYLRSGMQPEQLGHDLWLTAEHHGAGFWDRGLGILGELLTKQAHLHTVPFLYAENGKIHAG